MSELTSRAMLVSLNISQWKARKTDARVAEEVAHSHGADVRQVNFTKRLLAKEALSEITRTATEARTFHYEQTLPWLDNGARILPAANFLVYTERMRDLQARFDAAVRQFAVDYPNLRDEAAKRLGNLFNPKEYPKPEKIERRFVMDVAVMPLPDAQDFRVDLGNDELARIREGIERRTRQALEDACRDLWQRVYDVVSVMSVKLKEFGTDEATGERRYFKDTLVDNIRTVAELLTRLNVVDDPELERIRQRIVKDLCKHEAYELREDIAVRQTVASSADDILAAMAGYIGDPA